MKKVFRYEDNKDYWNRRWMEAGQDNDLFSNLTIYPIKYAEMVVKDKSQTILELGAGLGRVLKHYHYSGFKICGMEFSKVAVKRIKEDNPDIHILRGDVNYLPYNDGQFDVVLGFGLFHNIEEGFNRALLETARCLKAGGKFCISMRPNNIEMNLNEWYCNWKRQDLKTKEKKFHKWLLYQNEFVEILQNHKMITKEIYRARNMSILYRLPWLRGESSDEAEQRTKGYRLNRVGMALDVTLQYFFPSQFCNVLVYVGVKTD